jgi:hypothetical protein
MADDNVILRLLREIRADQQDQSKRLIRVERRLDEVHESMTTALGMAAHSNVVVEQFGQRFDELEDRLAALQTALPNWNQNDG